MCVCFLPSLHAWPCSNTAGLTHRERERDIEGDRERDIERGIERERERGIERDLERERMSGCTLSQWCERW